MRKNVFSLHPIDSPVGLSLGSFFKILLAVFFLCLKQVAFGQPPCNPSGGCNTGATNQYPLNLFSSTQVGVWIQVSPSMNAGNWTLFNVVAGNTYDWTYCSGFTSLALQNFDCQLTLFNHSTNQILCFNGDSGLSSCPNAPYIRWTATFTGTVRLLTTVYTTSGCHSNTGTPYSKLAWRLYQQNQVSPPTGATITTSTGANSICAGSSLELTASASGSNLTYQWSTGSLSSTYPLKKSW